MSEEIDAARDARVRIMVFGRLPARTAARLAEAGVRITPSAETAWAAPGAAVGPTDPADLIRGADGAPHLLVLQPPVGRAEYTAALRAARATGAELRIVDPVRGRDSVEDFVMAARTLNDREGIGVVRVRCMAEEVYTAFHIITDAFGRPRRLSRAESGVLEGTAGGTRFALRVGGGALRLAAASSAGELVLVSEDGPLLWCADEYGPEAVTPVTGRASALADDRRRALLRELTVRGSPADSRSRSQQEILLSGVLEDARELCPAGTWEAGRSRPPSAGRVHAADLLARPSDDVPLRLPFSDLACSAAEAAGAAAVDPRRIGRLREATAVADSYSRAAMARLLRPVLPARSAAEVIDRLGASRRHAWLVRRWLAALIRSRVLEDGEGVLSPGAAPDDPGERSLAEAYNLLGFNPLMTRLHTEIAGRLGELIRDETRIEEILFAHHDIVPALTAYQDNVVSRYLNAALADAVGRAVPADRPLRIVELGAGGGICTRAVLRALDGRGVGAGRPDYLFTDVSPAFVSAARDRLSRPGLRFGLLDINADLVDQGEGLEPGGTDVVVAANVLHNAEHVGRTLRRIRRLLRPGGVLAVVESTRDSHAVLTSMAFLLSPADGERSADEVFLDRRAWRRELVGAGFALVFDLPDPDGPLDASGQHLVLGAAL